MNRISFQTIQINQVVVSFVATLSLSKLKKKINCQVNLVRAIPMPPISLGLGPVAMCPPNTKVKNFFNKVGYYNRIF